MQRSGSNMVGTAAAVSNLLRGRSIKDPDVLRALDSNSVANFGAYPAGDYEDYGGNAKYDVGGVGGAGVGAGGGHQVGYAGVGVGGYGNIERSSGYGHSGYGGHGHGHGGYGKKKLECCELVVDPLTFAALMAAIIGGTAFLNVVVTMVLGRKRRRRRRSQWEGPRTHHHQIFDVFNLGKGQGEGNLLICMELMEQICDLPVVGEREESHQWNRRQRLSSILRTTSASSALLVKKLMGKLLKPPHKQIKQSSKVAIKKKGHIAHKGEKKESLSLLLLLLLLLLLVFSSVCFSSLYPCF